MLKSYTNIPFRHLWCVSLFGRPRNVFGVRKISAFAEIWFPLLQQWTHFLCFWHLIVFWFGKILTVFSHAPKSKWFWRHRGPTKISCQTRSPFHLKETSVNLMEIGFPLKESSILLKHASARGAEPVAPTEAPHHGHGAATRRRGVEPVVPPEAPQQRPGRRQQLRNLYRGIGDRTIFTGRRLLFL